MNDEEQGKLMDNIMSIVVAAFLLFLLVGFVILPAWHAFKELRRDTEKQAQVFVLREYMCESDKGPAKVIEYFVDGLPSVAVFYDGDAEKLEAFRKYLRKVGQ